MSRRGNRPSAFDVSFPDEPPLNAPLTSSSSTDPSTSRSLPRTIPQVQNGAPGTSNRRNTPLANDSRASGSKSRKDRAQKRPSESAGSPPNDPIGKRTRLQAPPGGFKPRYQPQVGDIRETAQTLIFGEEDEDPIADDAEEKPIRLLTDFSIFDPSHHMEMISLDLLVAADGTTRDQHFEAAGFVAPVFENEEDAGQEDDGDGEQEGVLQRIHTSAVFRYSFDFAKADDPVYLETQYAYYMLRDPSKKYKPTFMAFYRPLRVAQVIISTAIENPQWTYADFRDATRLVIDRELRQVITEELIQSAIPTIASAIDTTEECRNARGVPMIQDILNGRLALREDNQAPPVVRAPPPPAREVTYASLSGNLDLAVLRPENQNRTHVSSLIERLSVGLFPEHLEVVGPPPRPVDKREQERQRKRKRLFLYELIEENAREEGETVFPGAERLRGQFWRAVRVNGKEYRVGDVIITPAGASDTRKEPVIPKDVTEVPENASVADYFWFGRIIFIDLQRRDVHVQFFEHSSKTMLGQISDPQELFLTESCGYVDVRLIMGKVQVYRDAPGRRTLGPLEYFYNFLYNEADATFADINDDAAAVISDSQPPDNCVGCAMAAERDHRNHAQAVPATPQQSPGVTYRGTTYHVQDFVMIKSDEGPCDIGQIQSIRDDNRDRSQRSIKVVVAVLGRMNDIISICPPDLIKDERHLFLTQTYLEIPVTDLIQRCHVLHPDALNPSRFSAYLEQSPFNFYARYRFPTQTPESWDEGKKLKAENIGVCAPCTRDDLKTWKQLSDFLKTHEQKPLRAFDPFAGVGAFGMAMEGAGVIKVTHAIEISPSAAKTLKRNSPDTVVYNQCANIMLRYAIKTHGGYDVAVPKDLADGKAVPPPPRPEDIDCLIAGFPCQPHSRLNMFQKANDRKSHLILNLLSWIDFLKPKYCFFENVRGFLNYNINAVQASKYKVTGGIEMGGLMFFIRALLAMNYQVRLGLLQAGQYGTPQSRVRFFLIAAKTSYPLPLFPRPSHYFPVKDALEMKFPNGRAVRTVVTGDGVSPMDYVSIEDAIGDLPRFDWQSPRRPNLPPRRFRNPSDPTVSSPIPVLPCDKKRAYCGISGALTSYQYEKPRTTFQAKAREKPTTNIQHYTRVLKNDIVERVVTIPLRASADYKTLPADLWEWQFANPNSAVARDSFRPGLYGRLDKDRWFHTTVTNVEPTAKQSWVLNPYCKRVVTVRELARSQGFPDSFVFYSIDNNVKTMQRQIGNAVPWPVGLALGRSLRDALFKKWVEDMEEAIVVE